ncbi:MAG TPA: methyltransferase domain-containing protein [Candidatus Nanopelagicales bacterium]|nr:methyltransferase domain-containing protein [Candidatus Nanopelagicales bacterium]
MLRPLPAECQTGAGRDLAGSGQVGWPLPAMPYVAPPSTVVGMTTIDLTDNPTQQAHDIDLSRVEELVGRLLASFTGGVELLTIELGRRAGLYQALAEHAALNPAGLAAATGISERYAREWLEQQAAAGFLDVAAGSTAADRTYSLPTEHVPVLLQPTHPAHFGAAGQLLQAVAAAVPAVAEAHLRGGGVAYDAFGDDLRAAIGAINRPGFVHGVRSWVDALPDVADRLDLDGGVVLDLGSGEGWSSIALAKEFPLATVVGVDLDEASAEAARRHAREYGVADRATFAVGNAADQAALVRATGGRPVTLATAFQALHDMGRPADALAAVRGLLADHGAVLVGDEAGADEFTAPATEDQRLKYAMSVLHCLPATTAEHPGDPNGTVLRTDTVRAWASAAGFEGVQVLDIEHPFWRFYRL